MSDPIVTISGQRVYPLGRTPEAGAPSERPQERHSTERPVVVTEMSPSGWASGGNEETFEAGLPFLGGVVAVIVLTITLFLILKRRR